MAKRKPALIAAQVVLTAAVVWLAWRSLAKERAGFAEAWSHLQIKWLLVLLSGGVVFVSYAVLIETWRRVVTAWGGAIPYRAAARIWFVSNLGRYVPGKVWQIAAMGVMAQQAGVSGAVAVGSALYINIINVIAGFAVWLLCAPAAFPIPVPATVALGIAAVAFVLTPRAVPAVVSWVAKRVGRDMSLAPLPYGVIAATFASCALAWALYGVAFQILAMATIQGAGGDTLRYIALYTGPYLVGYLALFAAGGIGIRESSMIALADRYKLMSAPEVAILAIVSRIWLTILELVPGLMFLALTPKSPTPSSHDARPV